MDLLKKWFWSVYIIASILRLEVWVVKDGFLYLEFSILVQAAVSASSSTAVVVETIPHSAAIHGRAPCRTE